MININTKDNRYYLEYYRHIVCIVRTCGLLDYCLLIAGICGRAWRTWNETKGETK